MEDVKRGHSHIREFHFHIYWFQNNRDQGICNQKIKLSDAIDFTLFSFFYSITKTIVSSRLIGPMIRKIVIEGKACQLLNDS